MSGKQYLDELLSNLNAFAGISQDRIAAIVEYVAEIERAAALSVPAAAVVGEPVAWRCKMGDQYWHYFTKEPRHKEPGEVWEPLYAAPSAPEGWQSIETAKKDHQAVWVSHVAGMMEPVFFKSGVGKGFWANLYTGHPIQWRPSHWQPLPAPPALGGKP